MKKLELLMVLYSLEALHEEGKPDTAHKVIKRLILQAESKKKKKKNKMKAIPQV